MPRASLHQHLWGHHLLQHLMHHTTIPITCRPHHLDLVYQWAWGSLQHMVASLSCIILNLEHHPRVTCILLGRSMDSRWWWDRLVLFIIMHLRCNNTEEETSKAYYFELLLDWSRSNPHWWDYNQAKTAIRMERTGDDLTPTCVLLGLLGQKAHHCSLPVLNSGGSSLFLSDFWCKLNCGSSVGPWNEIHKCVSLSHCNVYALCSFSLFWCKIWKELSFKGD